MNVLTIPAILLGLLLSGFSLSQSKYAVLKPGLYEFFYVSTHITGDSVNVGSWKKPLKLNHNDNVAYKVINEKLIYRGTCNPRGQYQWIDTLIGVPKEELSKYSPVPTKILDFKLVGVYYPDRRFSDTFRVIYYSEKRSSIVDQLHVYTLNKINYLVVYMNKPYHPFYDINKYFKIPEDINYTAPVQKMEFN